MENKSSNIMAYYINVYINDKGKIEDSENGIMDSYEKAKLEAIEYSLNVGWKYIDTLSNHEFRVDFTRDVMEARKALEEHSFEDSVYGSEEEQISSLWKSQRGC